MTAAELLTAAYQAHGIVAPELLESFLAGTNLRAEVSQVILEKADLFVVYVRDGGSPGIHAAPIDEDPAALGIVLDKRHPEIFEVIAPLAVVRSIAADFEEGKVPRIGGKGGGVQFILPPEWRSSVKRVNDEAI